MKKVVIHPDYAFCAEFIDRLPEVFHREGQTIFKARNELKIFKYQGLELVVKSFKTPHFINQFAYTALRASKAERAYKYALMLKNKEILTPAPVAYIEIKKFGLLFNSYFISIKSRFNREIRELSNSQHIPPEAYPVLMDFARFTAGLHQKGVFHKDYTPGNILFGKVGDHYEFELVDLNRIKFCEVGQKDGCKNLRKLWFQDDMYRFFAREYAAVRHLDVAACEKMIVE
jgi:tRNA A-37 threonylcarbamoyl transferase component Bud32